MPHNRALRLVLLQDGNWSDVSGENFLRTLLTKPVEEIRCVGSC